MPCLSCISTASLTVPTAVWHQREQLRGRAKALSSSMSGSISTPSSSSTVDLLILIQRLKETKRTGWVKRGVKGPESIADHMYRMGMMSLITCPDNIDRDRCIRMALVHDLAEAIVGDIPPNAGVSKEDKAKMEQDAILEIKSMIGMDTRAAKDIEELFNEYEGGATPEAQLVKDFDKLEMILQAHEYEQGQGHELQEFFDSTAGKFKTDTGKALAAEIVGRRKQSRQ